MALQVVGLFCEDIREEKSGQDSIVGVLPDNLQVNQTPSMLPKLGVYIRFVLDKDDTTVRNISLKIISPGGQEIPFGEIDQIIEQARTEAASRDMPYAGFIAKAVISPFPIFTPGKIEVVFRVNGVERTCAALNVVSLGGSTPAPTASPQPSELSPIAAA
jgi:hypothetical protein